MTAAEGGHSGQSGQVSRDEQGGLGGQPVDVGNGPLQRYLDHLARLRIDDVVVIGGAVRDTLLGTPPKDVDVAVVLRLPDSLERDLQAGIAAGQPLQALNMQFQLIYRIEHAIERRRRLLALSGGWRTPARDGTFGGVPVQFSFLSAVVSGALINLSRSAAFTIDQMGLDGERRFYEAASQDARADMAAKHLRLARPAWNDQYAQKHWTLWTVLRALRYEYQYGFTFAFDPAVLEQAAQQLEPVQRGTLAELRKMVKLELFLASLDPTLKRTHQRYALRRIGWYLKNRVTRAAPREYRMFDAFLASLPPQRTPDAMQRLTDLGVFRTFPELAGRVAAHG